jgi:hypothetical protein
MLTYTTTILNDPQGDGRGTAALGINNLGEVAGYYISGLHTPYHGFTYNSGSYTSVDGPGFNSFVEDVNDAGEVFGYCTFTTGVGDRNFGFVGSNQLSAPNSIETIPTGINNTGEIVGSYMDSGGRHHGFIYNGGFATLDAPNASATYAEKIRVGTH